MRSISREFKIGLFALLVIVLLIVMTFRVGGIALLKPRGYTVSIYFEDVSGVAEKSRVKVAGVDVGVINNISLEKGRAKVTTRINKEVKLFSDAVASIKVAGFLGDRFVEIKPGSKPPLLNDGAVITKTTEFTDVDELMRNVSEVAVEIGKLSSHFDELFGEEKSRQNVRETLANLNEVTKNLNKAIAQSDMRFRKTLDQLNELTVTLNEIVKSNREPLSSSLASLKDLTTTLNREIPPLITSMSKTTQDFRTTIDENRPALKSTIDNLERITEKVESGKGTLGKLINDDRLYESFSSSAEGIGKAVNALSAFERFRLILSARGEYLARHKEGKGYLSLTLRPKPEQYYIFGVVSDPLGKVSSDEKRTRRTEFTAQVARRFTTSPTFKNTALRGGLTENTFGMGADQFFMNDKLKFSLDAWDFTRDQHDAKNPHMKFDVNYLLYKHLFISAGLDDIINSRRQTLFFGGGMVFGQ